VLVVAGFVMAYLIPFSNVTIFGAEAAKAGEVAPKPAPTARNEDADRTKASRLDTSLLLAFIDIWVEKALTLLNEMQRSAVKTPYTFILDLVFVCCTGKKKLIMIN